MYLRLFAWLAISTMPFIGWWAGGLALDSWRGHSGYWTVDLLFAAAGASIAAVVAAYLALTSAVMIASAATRQLAFTRFASAIAPAAWRKVTATALGVGLSTGIALPSFATQEDPADSLHIGWAPPPVAEQVGEAAVIQVRVDEAVLIETPDAVSQAPSPLPTEVESPKQPAPNQPASNQPAPTRPAPTQLAPNGTTTGSTTTRNAQESPLEMGQYEVQRGDSLWRITARHLGADATDAEIAAAWPQLYEENRAVIGANPSLIHAGQVLSIPGGLT